MKYFVTAIGTDSGKTLVSAILCKATGFSYWKPIQAGLEERDSNTITSLLPNVVVHNESYCLTEPMSPHAAAKIDKVEIDPVQIKVPQGDVIIEGAGGIMVPLHDNYHIADLIQAMICEVILVCNLYLGSINHSLLTINELKSRKIKVKGIIFNGEPNQESEEHILSYSGYEKLLHILPENEITTDVVEKYASQLKL